MNLFEIAHSLHRQFGADPWCIYRGKHLMTFADNHDVTRLASILTNKKHICPAYGLLFGMPGIPCLYYGSEWGTEGEKAPDNDVTRLASILTNKKHICPAYGLLFGMPGIPCLYYGSEWGTEGEKAPDNDYALRPCFETPKPNELTEFIQKLIHLRQTHEALGNGSYRNVIIQNHQLVFERKTESERIFVAINASDAPFTACHGDLTGTAVELLNDTELILDQLVFERKTESERIFVAINASDAPFTACHGDLTGTAVELLNDTELILDGKLELPPYSVQYINV